MEPIIVTRKFRIQRLDGRRPVYLGRYFVRQGNGPIRVLERVLCDGAGKPIRPSETASVEVRGNLCIIVGEDAAVHQEVQDSRIRTEISMKERGELWMAPMTVEQAMERYLEYHAKTFRDDRALMSHASFVVDEFGIRSIHEVARGDVKRWIASMCQLSGNTIRNRVSAPKALYNWLIDSERYFRPNPFAGHRWKESGNRRVKAACTEAMWKIVQNVTEDPATIQVLTILYHTGIRPSEACRAVPDDFDLANNRMIVHVTKTGVTDRVINIPAELSDFVRTASAGWHSIKQTTLANRVAELKRRHPALLHFTAESMRYGFQARMLDAGEDIRRVAGHQGHSPRVALEHYEAGEKKIDFGG